MRSGFAVLGAMICFATTVRAEEVRSFVAEGLRFSVMGDSLHVELAPEGRGDSLLVAVNSEGELFLDSSRVTTDGGDRKRLRRFVSEVARLGELLDGIGAAVATQQDPSADAEFREAAAQRIARIARDLEKQRPRVAKIALDLYERIPELRPLLMRFQE